MVTKREKGKFLTIIFNSFHSHLLERRYEPFGAKIFHISRNQFTEIPIQNDSKQHANVILEDLLSTRNQIVFKFSLSAHQMPRVVNSFNIKVFEQLYEGYYQSIPKS